MTKQYWINDFFIDVSRNQITQKEHPQTIPPKALAVLTYLAEHQGRVVSQDELLDHIWPDTVVTPNTLQRSIALLRKALGDDGKVQTFIKTHAKQGYSLECDVRWNLDPGPTVTRDEPEDQQPTNTQEPHRHKPATAPRPGLKLLLALVVVVLLGLLTRSHWLPETSSTMRIEHIRSLTATDDKEFDPSYTPDGEHIVFHRYQEKLCVNHLWAKHTDTQNEVRLTKDWGAYGRHSFSADGTELVFLATQACDQPSSQTDCYDLVRLDFQKALKSPQQPEVMLQCQNTTVNKPIWLNNHEVTLLQLVSGRWKLISYSMERNQSTTLFELPDGNILDYAYSPSEDLLAVISIHEDGRHYLEMLKPDGQLLSSHLIERLPEIPPYRPLSPNFAPLNQQLVFSTGRQMFTLSYEGQVNKIDTAFADKVMQPEFHASGKKLLMIKGPYDSDVVQLPLSQLNTDTSDHPLNPLSPAFTPFERTNLGENDAQFQPGGDLIAFWSERSGEGQIWISDGQQTRQLTGFPTDNYIRGFDWAHDGQSLLVNVNDTLIQVFLDASTENHTLDFPVLRLYQWDSQHNSVLVMTRKQGVYRFTEYDLNQARIITSHDKPILWGRKTEQGQLIYKDTNGHFWKPGAVEDQRLDRLNHLRSKTKSFVLHDSVIYAIDEDHRLWSYDLMTDTFALLADVGKAVDSITDVNPTHLLFTVQVAAKKEVVELTVGQ